MSVAKSETVRKECKKVCIRKEKGKQSGNSSANIEKDEINIEK